MYLFSNELSLLMYYGQSLISLFPLFTILLLELTGEQRGKPPQGSKIPLFVKIGGIRYLVESQYISNQDFLEVSLWLLSRQPIFQTLYIRII